jgi:hypothetical protein
MFKSSKCKGNLQLTSSWIIQTVAAWRLAIGIFALAALPAAASQVDTLVTSDVGGGCNSVGILQGTVSASLPFNLCQAAGNTLFGAGASAVADYLSLGTSASASWKSDFPGGGLSASATAQSADVLTVGGGNPGDLAFLRFQFAISGTNSTILTGFTGTSSADSFTNLVVCNFNPILLPIAIGCPGPAPEAIFHFDALNYSNLPVQVDVPIHFDVPWGVFFELYSTTGAVIDPNFVVSFSGSSSFIDTAKITSVSVLDANLQPIADPTLVADSGTLYPLLGASSPGPQPSVPEPSGMMLLLTGAAGLIGWRKRSLI